MKIRAGFVSNSSTSSFSMYGAEIDKEQFGDLHFEEFLSDETLQDVKSLIEEGEVFEAAYVLQQALGKDWFCDGHYDGCSIYVGKYYTTQKDDDVVGEWRKEIRDTIVKLMGKQVECGHQEEAWSDY